eukprot:TRINITY_DN917_c0_g1_i11.p1 TRINITY_DN917_c0_g1~~TRINITY_DN917_c0_g1_i11.p1  ORF type:complete len:378 (+),score=94.09 TRINITY_DN917_c0_g1_i11:28-1161(+)
MTLSPLNATAWTHCASSITEGEEERSWLHKARKREEDLKMEQCPRAPLHRKAAIIEWNTLERLCIRTEGEGTKKLEVTKQRTAALEMIAKLPKADITVYTDGSVEEGKGGAGIVIERAGGTATEISVGVCNLCDSFQAEMNAINTALARLVKEDTQGAQINLLTDSMACLQKLKQGPAKQQEDMVVEAWHNIHALTTRGNHLTCCFIPGHCGIEGNEKADQLASNGRDKEATQKISMGAAKNYIRKTGKQEILARLNKEKTCNKWAGRTEAPKKMEGLNRKEEVLINQLKTGHHDLLKVGYAEQRICVKCGPNTKRTLQHLFLDCPSSKASRDKHFDTLTLRHILVENPRKAIQYLEDTGDLPPSATTPQQPTNLPK